MIPIHTLAAVDQVGAVCIDVGIIVISAGSIVDTVPAVGESLGVTYARIIWIRLETVGVRQGGDEIASCAHIQGLVRAGVARVAEAGHTGSIGSIGNETCKRDSGSGLNIVVHHRIALHQLQVPTGGRARLGPGKVETVRAYVRGRNCRRSGASDSGARQRVAQTVCGQSGIGACAVAGRRHRAVPCTGQEEPVVAGAVGQIGGKRARRGTA